MCLLMDKHTILTVHFFLSFVCFFFRLRQLKPEQIEKQIDFFLFLNRPTEAKTNLNRK